MRPLFILFLKILSFSHILLIAFLKIAQAIFSCYKVHIRRPLDCVFLDWLQSPVTKYIFLIIMFDNPLRKHAYSNILKISPPKTEIFQIKNSDIFYISAQNIDCGYSLEPPRRGGSNEYHNLYF